MKRKGEKDEKNPPRETERGEPQRGDIEENRRSCQLYLSDKGGRGHQKRPVPTRQSEGQKENISY